MNRTSDLLLLLGAVIGGLLGYVVFIVLARRDFHGLALPGGVLGLGEGIFKRRLMAVPIVCGFLALVLGLFAEWWFASFAADGSLGYFVTHIHQLRPLTLIMIGVGTLIGFCVPFRRRQGVENAQPCDEIPNK